MLREDTSEWIEGGGAVTSAVNFDGPGVREPSTEASATSAVALISHLLSQSTIGMRVRTSIEPGSWFVDLAEIIGDHLGNDEIVQVVDGEWPGGDRLRYTIQWTGAGHVFDGHGRPLGVFADLDALVEHAETVTA